MSSIAIKLRSGSAALHRAFTPSQAAWTGATVALYGLWAFLVVWGAWKEVLPHLNLGNVLGLIGLYGGLALVGALGLLLFALANCLKRPFRTALFLVLPTAALFLILTWLQGSLIALPVLLGGLSLFFGAAASLMRRPASRTASIVWLLVGAAILALGLHALLARPADLNPALAHYHLQGQTLPLPDPGQRGPNAVIVFTYGTGKDLHRPEYGKSVRLLTQPVDAAKLDIQWAGFAGALRTRYWGFDAAHLPLQGHVWMPQGPGRFPLVLVAHGNHNMEEFSDPGYAYLGETLASQGFILVSVDENFLNSGGADWADPTHRRQGQENSVRAWLLLEHLRQWRDWQADPRSPLYGRADMNRIALIGHSRGGEAVALANVFNELSRFPDDATVPFDFHFHLHGVVAIAPTDGMYRLRSSATPMRDQNYLVIGGSLDGDNGTAFLGASQYSRAAFSGKVPAFKASLYIKDANHGQFNTVWGRNDSEHAYRFLTDERSILDAGAQRRIATVYLSAFLRVALNGEEAYRPLFQDARNGGAWLPDVYMVNNYADSRTRWLANFEEDADPTSGSEPDVTIGADGLTVWRETDADVKSGHLDTHVALLAWDDRTPANRRSYQLEFTPPAALSPDTDLVFGASQAEIDTLPAQFAASGPRRNEDNAPLDWTLVLSDVSGQEARLPLSHDQVLYPQLKGATHRAAGIDGYPRSELVMRRFRLPLKDFAAANPQLDLKRIRSVRFDFDRSRRGAIALDDIGLSPSP